jgi:hypothetical protein
MTRLDCTVQVVENQKLVGKQFQGVARLAERAIDEHMTFWFGAINIDCSSVPEWYALWERQYWFVWRMGASAKPIVRSAPLRKCMFRRKVVRWGAISLFTLWG